MKFRIILLSALIGLLAACQEEERVFEKSADQRAAEAIDSLKMKLTAPANGWLLRYRPEQQSGTFNVLLQFNEDNTVHIQTDFPVNEGEFYEQTNTYRIDNSLGLELIIENYSFFSYLFEQNQATFGAEFEFNFVNETNGALVFRSKTDASAPTTLVFQPASANAVSVLGKTLAGNLQEMASNEDLSRFTSLFRMNYTNRDLALFFTYNTLSRVINFTYAAPASDMSGGKALNFTTGYTLQGDSLLLQEPLSAEVAGMNISVSAIAFDELTDASLQVCEQTIPARQFSAKVGTAPVILQTTLDDPQGAEFFDAADFFVCAPQNIFEKYSSQGQQLAKDIEGLLSLQLYNRQNLQALGFAVQNPAGSLTFALKDFTYTMEGNKVNFDFAENYTLYDDTTATVNTEKMDFYLNKLTEGEQTYIFEFSDGTYEFYNACNGWSFVFWDIE